MRFAIKTAPQHTSWSDMLAVWQRADEIDIFESAWNFDHFYPIFSDSTGPCLEAWTMLAAMANAPDGIGMLVTGNIYRHWRSANGGDGRHHLERTARAGISGLEPAGVRRLWHHAAPLLERFDMFDEACEVLIAVHDVRFEGRYYQLNDARWPKPVQRIRIADLHRRWR
jgi:alkanesulfonate monooxygenase SsuD/methylene tetrahydromethanopterin reductase-like flavin-dependent oxidoreductase (luciferase family)